MRKFLLIASLLVCTLSIDAVSFNIDGINYSITGMNTVEVVSGGTYIGNLVIPSSVTNSSVLYNVTSIGWGAFYGCSGLIDIVIPNSVTYIGNFAFHSCTGLLNVSISNSVLFIGVGAFYGCTGLTKINIPSSVYLIDSYAFWGCKAPVAVSSSNQYYSSVNGVLYDKSQTTLLFCPVNYVGAFSIPSSVIIIGNSAFSGCANLTSISIPNSLMVIGESAFQGCVGLTNIVIPNTVDSIGSYAFNMCTGLKTLIISASLSTISSYLVSGCTSLSNMIIPNTVSKIGNGAFYGCTGLVSIDIPSSVNIIGSVAFLDTQAIISVSSLNPNYSSRNGILYNKEQTCLIHCPSSMSGEFSIPTTVTSIFDYAFWGCTNLTSVNIPSSVNTIGNGAFQGCTGLSSMVIPLSVNSVSNDLFWGCSGLVYLSIPPSVTRIGVNAFRECRGLNTVNIPSSVTYIGSYAFDKCVNLSNLNSFLIDPMNLSELQFSGINTSTCKLNVPIGTKSLYQTALGWKDFLNITEFSSTSTQSVEISPLRIFPTISTDKISIRFENSEAHPMLFIFNMQGIQLYETNLVDNKLDINVSDYSAGLYCIKVVDKVGGVLSVGRFMKR